MGTVAKLMADVLGAGGAPAADQSWAEADALHGLLVMRADSLLACTDSSAEGEELRIITDALEAYELKRWPEGKVLGKG